MCNGSTPDSDSVCGGSNPSSSAKKEVTFVYQKLLLFLSKPQAWYIITARSAVHIISPFGAVYHHASACISLRLDDIPQQVADDIQCFALVICNGKPLIYFQKYGIMRLKRVVYMAKNYLLVYAEQLATDVELLCQNIKTSSNTLFQIRKSSSSVYANIREANYGQSKADMLSKFEIALKECSETEGWLQLLFNTQIINKETFKSHRNLCGRIRRMLIASCKTLKENTK